MDFNDTPEEAKFRKEAYEWLASNAELKEGPKDSWRASSEEEGLKQVKIWQKKLHEGGWACLHWPKTYGGRESTPIERVIWGQEVSKFKVPGGYLEIGQGMAGPVMMMYATEEQKERYLPPMATGEEIWCQLFSEPAAGSDVAGIKTKAELDGDTWTINGQKVWTSGAHFSDYGILVTRSDPSAPKHKGLTFFFVDMKSPGIEVKPIKQISGGANFNEVYFTDVKIPDSQRLGAVGDGWKVSLTTLMNERLAVGDASGPDFEEAFSLARGQDLNGKLAIENDSVREKLADWYCQQSGLKYAKYRNIFPFLEKVGAQDLLSVVQPATAPGEPTIPGGPTIPNNSNYGGNTNASSEIDSGPYEAPPTDGSDDENRPWHKYKKEKTGDREKIFDVVKRKFSDFVKSPIKLRTNYSFPHGGVTKYSNYDPNFVFEATQPLSLIHI